MSRHLFAVPAAALMTVAALSPALAAPAISPAVTAVMGTQAELHKIADRVDDGAGFGGVYVDAPSRTLTVYWKGEAPATLRAEAATAQARGLTVKVLPARFTRAELRAESERLIKADASLSSVGPKYDGSGLVAKGSRPATLASNVPVEVRPADQWKASATRLRDDRPFKGGGYVDAWENGERQWSCTTGFAVVDNSTSEVKGLTAAHCGVPGTVYTNHNGLVGTVTAITDVHDGGLITNTGDGDAFAAKVWVGDSILGPNQHQLDVVGASATLAGDVLCNSGALSGTICGIRAESTGNWIRWGGGYLQNMVVAQQVDGYSAGGFGDSGGPVFSVTPDNRLTARGTMTAISISQQDIRQCGGVPSSDERLCSQYFIYPDITFTTASLNVRIKTVS